MRAFIAVFLCLAALPAAAADEPEAIYAKYHRGAVSGDQEDVLAYAAAQQRKEISALSPAQRNAAVKMMAATMPRAFVLKSKTVAPDGNSARLLLSGPGGSVLDNKPEVLYGSVRMVMERGAWKVAETSWSNQPPAGLAAAAKPPAAASQKATAQKAAARGAPMVGSINAAPERKLGIAKEPCVYKPVMTAEDMENCK